MNTNISVISVAGDEELAKQIGNLKPNEEVEIKSRARFKEMVADNATFMLDSTEIQPGPEEVEDEEGEEEGAGIMGEMLAGESQSESKGAPAVISALNPRATTP